MLSVEEQKLHGRFRLLQALADISGGQKKVMVPYRDSVLTKLLQNALGGNRFVRCFVASG